MESALTPIMEAYNRQIMAVEQARSSQVALGLKQSLPPRSGKQSGSLVEILEAKLDTQIVALEAKLNCQAVEVNGR